MTTPFDVKNSPSPELAVVITCFNEGAWLRESVASVLEQTIADAITQIVIVDDGSEPSTIAVLDDVATWDSRIVVLRQARQGVAKNRNLGVRSTRAPFVAFLDADDWWDTGKLEAQIARCRHQPDLGLVYTGFVLFDDGRPESGKAIRVHDHAAAKDLTRAYFLNDAPVVPSTILVRRSAFVAVGGFDETIRVFEDTDFFFRLSQVTRFAAVQKPLTSKRNHANSMTSRRGELMAHHAAVAFRFAAREPRLLPLVARRLAERARKLGSLEASDGRSLSATQLYRLSLSLWPFHLLTWVALCAQLVGGDGLIRSLRALRSRSV